jgi:hypothetical protein
MELNKKQIFLIILLLMVIFPPINTLEESFDPFVGVKCEKSSGYTFIYFIVGSGPSCISFYDINYQLLILQILILCSVFLFILFKKKK